MVSSGLLQQVGELDRADQMELVDYIYQQQDTGVLDDETRHVLDLRLADLDANPDDETDLDEALRTLRAAWQRRTAS